MRHGRKPLQKLITIHFGHKYIQQNNAYLILRFRYHFQRLRAIGRENSIIAVRKYSIKYLKIYQIIIDQQYLFPFRHYVTPDNENSPLYAKS